MNARTTVSLFLVASVLLCRPVSDCDAAEKADVAIYGATPAGIAAALAAVDGDRQVFLIEPTARIGGLTTHGLSHSDFHSFESLHGPFLQFSQRVLEHYRKTYGEDSEQVRDSWRGTHGEPSVNLMIFKKILAEKPTMTVMKERRLIDVTTENQSITAARFALPDKSTITIQARMFIDASYEGDLLAAAGVPYRVGREARSEYGESLAPETADDELQGYNFRLCMTQVRENRVPIPVPENYDRKDYADLVSLVKADKFRSAFGYPGRPFVFKAHLPILPNGKHDINDVSKGLVRLSLPSHNREYPDGDLATRRRIMQEHLDWQLGLIHFVQTDPAIPEDFRKEAATWGLCRDEFTETGHIPPQIYVREARRMVGLRVYTEADTAYAPNDARARLHRDSIAVGEYSHNCHGTGHEGPRIGGKHNGEFYKGVAPYQIPYGVIVPRKLRNLLVPTACSSSHVGFCAIRLEPIWMSLGGAAGHAADLALEANVPVQQIDVEALQKRIWSQGGATVHVNDVPPDHPDFTAVQWWGGLGGLHGLEPAPRKPGARGKHIVSQYFEAFPGHAAKLDQPLDGELIKRWSALAKKNNLPVPTASKTRGDWIRKAFAAGQSLAEAAPGPSRHKTLTTTLAARAETVLADGEQARFKVIVSATAVAEISAKAQVLADHLGRISGAEFEVAEGSRAKGIAVGVYSDFPALADSVAHLFAPDDPFRQDEYLLRSHDDGLYVLGATPIAVSHAVWDCLHRLGYRRFFPSKKWEIIPRHPRLALAVDAFVAPDFVFHRYSGVGWDVENTVPPFKEWVERNRMTAGFDLENRHIYQAIIGRFQKEFEQHPEYYGLENGKRTSHKICIANPEVQALAIRFANEYLSQKPEAECVSMEPSDGFRWCECEDCAAFGSISDRALTLANVTARALQKDQPGKSVGMLAYNMHASPPSIRVESNVIVTLATKYATGGHSFDELRDGWQLKGASPLGIYDYFGLSHIHKNLPGRGKAANPERVASSIADFHEEGFAFYNGESCDSWGALGLGYYVGIRCMWDTDEAANVSGLVDDFLSKCFGSARTEMRAFYELIDGKNHPLLSEDLVGRMYRILSAARKATTDRDAQARIEDLVLYTRFVELYRAYSSIPAGDQRLQAFETYLRHAYRMRKTGLVDVKWAFVGNQREGIPDECKWRVPEAENPWKSSDPFSDREIDAIVEQGAANNVVVEFQPFDPATILAPSGLPPAKRGTFGERRGPHQFLLWATDGRLPELTISTGHLATNRGGVRWQLLNADDKVLQSGVVPPDRANHTVAFKERTDGPHWLRYEDQGAGTQISWPPGSTAVGVADQRDYQYGIGMRGLYFYVPEGTKQVVIWVSSIKSVTFSDASGRTRRCELDTWPNLVVLDVEEGQDGQAWSVASNVNGQFMLLNVPPYLAPSPDELLVPR